MTFECSQIESKTCIVNAGCLINLAFQLQNSTSSTQSQTEANFHCVLSSQHLRDLCQRNQKNAKR